MRTRENIGNSSMLDNVRAAALGIACIVVDTRTDNEFTLVGLARVAVHCVRHHHGIQHRLHGLGDECLKGMALDRETNAGHLR